MPIDCVVCRVRRVVVFGRRKAVSTASTVQHPAQDPQGEASSSLLRQITAALAF